MEKKRVLSILIDLLIVLGIYILFLYNGKENFSISTITIIGFLVNVYILISHYINQKSMKSIYFLFQFFSIPFLYGQVFVRYVLSYIPENMVDLSSLVTQKGQVLAIFLIIFCQLFLNIGYKLIKNAKKQDNIDEIYNQKKMIKIGVILIAISIIPTFINYYETLKVCLIYGYSGKGLTVTYGIDSIFSKFIPFFYIGLLCLIYGYKDHKISKYLLMFSVLFYGSEILFGNRGTPLLMVICLLWFYNYYVKKLNRKKFVLLLICGFFLISLLNVIRLNRSDGISDWISNSGDLLVDNIQNNNPLFELNYEVGTTIYPIAYTLEHVPLDLSYRYGKSYLLSLYSVIKINLDNGSNEEFKDEMNVSNIICKMAKTFFGGSFIQEAYANFGWYCVIFMMLLGMLMKKIDNFLIKNTNYIIPILLSYFSVSLLWTIRNTMVTLPREFFWYCLPVYILYKILGRRKESLNG